jgi:hypothetical protein
MNSKLAKIVQENFKANAELKEQYIFDDGYCYYHKARAIERANETKKKFHTVKRDAKVDLDTDKAKKQIDTLQIKIKENQELLLDAASPEEKQALEEQIEGWETEIEKLKE